MVCVVRKIYIAKFPAVGTRGLQSESTGWWAILLIIIVSIFGPSLAVSISGMKLAQLRLIAFAVKMQ